jgi:hypothetical protein
MTTTDCGIDVVRRLEIRSYICITGQRIAGRHTLPNWRLGRQWVTDCTIRMVLLRMNGRNDEYFVVIEG